MTTDEIMALADGYKRGSVRFDFLRAAVEQLQADAERWRLLPAFLEEYQIDYLKLLRDIDSLNEPLPLNVVGRGVAKLVPGKLPEPADDFAPAAPAAMLSTHDPLGSTQDAPQPLIAARQSPAPDGDAIMALARTMARAESDYAESVENRTREAAELQGALTEAICKWREAERERDALALQVKMQPAPMADCPVYCKTAVDLKDRAERAEREAAALRACVKAAEEIAQSQTESIVDYEDQVDELRALLREARNLVVQVDEQTAPWTVALMDTLWGKDAKELLARIDAALKEVK